jgi:hypothetical protein
MRRLMDCASLCIMAIVLAFVLAVSHGAAQEGYIGHSHDKWHQGFYSTLNRPEQVPPPLKLTREQMISRQEARIAVLKDRPNDEGMTLDYLKDGGEFSDDLADSPDPWCQ